MDERYISPYKIKKKFDITSNTLKTWGESGKIRFLRIRDGKGKRLYNLEDVNKILGLEHGEQSVVSKKIICYARVSSDHQKEDLDRQIKLLQKSFPEAEIISDVGSGLNFKRKGLETLLEQVYSGIVGKVVVTYKDRLCRFGLETFEWIFKKHNTEFLVLNQSSDVSLSTAELSEDLLAVTTFFVARNNGIRSAKYRKQRKDEEEKKKEQEDKTKEEKQK